MCVFLFVFEANFYKNLFFNTSNSQFSLRSANKHIESPAHKIPCMVNILELLARMSIVNIVLKLLHKPSIVMFVGVSFGPSTVNLIYNEKDKRNKRRIMLMRVRGVM